MTPSEYQKLAARTLLPEPGFDIPGDQLMLVWCAIGLAGEAGEVVEAIKKYGGSVASRKGRISKELGDYLWYLAGICTAAQIDFGEATASVELLREKYSYASPLDLLQIATAYVTESIKKGIFHRHGIDPALLARQISACFYCLVRVADGRKISILTAMEQNIAKLRLRYPEGFTSEDSKKRVDVK